jgi:hypothetical protein
VGGYNNYLISIDEFSDYGTCVPLLLKGAPQVFNGMLGAVSMYSRHGHKVKKVVTDSENTFRKCEYEIGL